MGLELELQLLRGMLLLLHLSAPQHLWGANASEFKGGKVIFPLLPDCHLSSTCHRNLDVAKVARVILGLSQHAESWRSGHVHNGTGISLRFSGKAGTQFGVPKLEQQGKPCPENVCVLLQWCSHGFVTAAPTEVVDATVLSPGSAATQIIDGI